MELLTREEGQGQGEKDNVTHRDLTDQANRELQRNRTVKLKMQGYVVAAEWKSLHRQQYISL